jgi:hypothetical protein
MNKSLLVALALGSVLSACSSQPSDFRPTSKVSNDEVAPGTRDTDYSNFGTEAEAGHGHEATGHGHEAGHEAEGREDVMLNHDEGSNKIGPETEQVAPADKTTHADSVENHE